MSFFENVYDLVKKIPEGRVTTYGEIARALGTTDARRVGHALHANSHGDAVPCHRVVNKEGRLAPNFAFNGSEEQRRRLEQEGVTFLDRDNVNLKQHLFVFDYHS